MKPTTAATPESHQCLCSTARRRAFRGGEQEMSVWNGHYACTCYHPLFVFNQFGDLERCALRAGHVQALTAGTTCSSPSWRATRARSHASIFERTQPLQCPRSTSFWRRSGSNTRSGYRPTRFCRAGSAICSRAQSDDLRTMCAGSMPISAIKPEPGPSRGGLSPRSSGNNDSSGVSARCDRSMTHTKAAREPKPSGLCDELPACPVPFISCAKNNEVGDCLTCLFFWTTTCIFWTADELICALG